jgi:hypothetical protein
MSTKAELIQQLKDRGIEADPATHPATLAKMLKEAPPTANPTPSAPLNNPAPSERTFSLQDVKALIAEALATAKDDARAPIKVKKVTEHTAHVWRFDGKWVVDFKDRNTQVNPETGLIEKIDQYILKPQHAYQKFNEQTRMFEAWIEIVFNDGSTKNLPLTTYVEHRVPVYCPIIKRHQIDRSEVVGEVEKKKEVGDKYVGTGIVIDQEVNRYDEVFEIRTPEGTIYKISDYAIC